MTHYINAGFLEGCREEFEKGSTWALMQAIWVCAQDKFPLPTWAASAYIEKFDTIRNAEAKSWDEVFGRPYPKGSQIAAIKKARKVRWPFYNAVNQWLKEDPAATVDGVISKLSKKYGIGRTLAHQFYYDCKNSPY